VIYLLEYDRAAGRLVRFDPYEAHERAQASSDRLALEIELFRNGVNHEVVLLEAASEEALKKTHNRYFTNVSDLARSAKASVKLTEPVEHPTDPSPSRYSIPPKKQQ
jgi:hypothetical protein